MMEQIQQLKEDKRFLTSYNKNYQMLMYFINIWMNIKISYFGLKVFVMIRL